jgi:trehalose 6-phosphate synthase
MRLIACSNSGPARPHEADTALLPSAAGGLVPHLLALLRGGGEWLFPVAEGEERSWPRRVGPVGLRPVPLGAEARHDHYATISIELLLWLFHYLHDTATAPVFDDRQAHAWAGYRRVNEAFARRVSADPEALVLICDYHLMLVPAMLPAGGRVVYAHQVPWCEPDYFGLLPAALRREILTSLLACDTVVFHSRRWADAFIRCCDRYLPDVTPDDGLILHPGGTTRVVAVPLPLDAAGVRAIAAEDRTLGWRERFDEMSGGRRPLVRVDRLDLWKNHVRGFAAYEALLRRQPSLADEAWLLAVVTRPRHQTRRHAAYEAACQAAVTRLNQEWRRPGGPDPVTLHYATDPADTRNRAFAALGNADIVLVNPTWDGLNMVAREAAALSDTSKILLSRTAGAYEYLAPLVTGLDACDVAGTADAIQAALVGRTPAAGRAATDSLDAGGWLAAVRPPSGNAL